MSSYEIQSILQWWLVIFIIGAGFLPITSIIFSRFFDKGYIFSKLIGIAITTYIVYIFGILHILPFSQFISFVVIILTPVLITYYLPIDKKYFLFNKKIWIVFILEELMFLAALFFWCFIHGYSPDIHGLEKYMDYGFINSILRSDYFPPKDMWFSVETSPVLKNYFINYYYFGHLVTAFLTKLSGVSSALTFNIMLSTLFAFCFTQTFSIGANLFYFSRQHTSRFKFKTKLVLAGLLTAALTTLGGNLHIIYSFFEPYKVDEPKPIWELPFKPDSFPNAYWYPNATRYIYHTIHEFPIYSWVVADVHGHVLDIPFVLLMIALLISLFVKKSPTEKDDNHIIKWNKSNLDNTIFKQFAKYFVIHPFWLLFLGFLLAIMYMTNAWDGAIYFILTIAVIYFLIRERSKGAAIWTFLFRLLVPLIFIGTIFLFFSLPYNYFFKPFASNVGLLCSPSFLIKIGKIGPLLFEPDHCQHSYLWELMMLYGFFYFFVFSFLIFLKLTKKIMRMDFFILILIAVASLLIILPEFIYVKDIYPGHFRANTMFKLVFQAFIMLSIVSVYVITAISQTKKKFFFLLTSLILISLVMTYPYLAIGSYYGDLNNYQGLNGIKYLKNLYPDDFAGIEWLNANIKGQPVILEAQGDSYTDYARVSANTGLPAVLGWTVHEWLWRGDYSVPAPRITDITNLYETKDEKLAKKLIDKYKVKYVFIGKLEYDKYPKLYEGKFGKLGKLVFEKNRTKIYEIESK